MGYEIFNGVIVSWGQGKELGKIYEGIRGRMDKKWNKMKEVSKGEVSGGIIY